MKRYDLGLVNPFDARDMMSNSVLEPIDTIKGILQTDTFHEKGSIFVVMTEYAGHDLVIEALAEAGFKYHTVKYELRGKIQIKEGITFECCLLFASRDPDCKDIRGIEELITTNKSIDFEQFYSRVEATFTGSKVHTMKSSRKGWDNFNEIYQGWCNFKDDFGVEYRVRQNNQLIMQTSANTFKE